MSIINKKRVAILSNENPQDSDNWISACEKHKERIDYDVIDLSANDWLEKLPPGKYDLLLARPGGLFPELKQMYDERIYILAYIYGYRIFPSPQEIFIYENKRVLSYWLKSNNIPFPATQIFYNKNGALNHLNRSGYPIVAKTSIGASGGGVTIINDKANGERYISSAFSGKGIPQRVGPNLSKGNLLSRGLHYLIHPSDIGKKARLYSKRAGNLQKNFVLFQEFIPHEYEWRAVRIGDSYFAHKKVVKNGKASGTLLKIYDNPPSELLDFVRNITDKHRLYSVAIDIFESQRGYLVNEIQCFFGQSDSYQMVVEEKKGRYCCTGDEWIFEEGDFAANMCFDLRMEFVLKMLYGN